MTATKPTFRNLAAAMRQQLAERNGYRTLPLSRGLEIVLTRADARWTLTLKRADMPPSDVEIRIARVAFGVPDEPVMRAFKRKLPSPKTGELLTYHGVELSWREVEPVDPARPRSERLSQS